MYLLSIPIGSRNSCDWQIEISSFASLLLAVTWNIHIQTQTNKHNKHKEPPKDCFSDENQLSSWSKKAATGSADTF